LRQTKPNLGRMGYLGDSVPEKGQSCETNPISGDPDWWGRSIASNKPNFGKSTSRQLGLGRTNKPNFRRAGLVGPVYRAKQSQSAPEQSGTNAQNKANSAEAMENDKYCAEEEL
jgi:hypothetical protein